MSFEDEKRHRQQVQLLEFRSLILESVILFLRSTNELDWI